ncbi:MAG: TonB-dependent receptor [Sphingobium sp.]
MEGPASALSVRKGIPHIVLASLCLLPPGLARAQRVDDNPTLLADDAFGAAIGNERVGLYRGWDVRGFSAVTAGNIRLDGLYIDRPAEFSERLVANETIRVGITAQNYLFVAPTGVDEFRLRRAGGKPLLSAVASYSDIGVSRLEFDGQVPLNDRLSLAAGAGFNHMVYTSGATGNFASYALRARWQPLPGVEISPFWGRADSYDRQSSPTFVTAGPFVPTGLRTGTYVGPEWVGQRLTATNFGLIGKARIGPEWAAALGLFRSVNDMPRNYTLLLRDLTPDGRAARRIIADPPQFAGSTSGELRVERAFRDGRRAHLLFLSLRGRDRISLYGGSAMADYPRGDVNALMDVEAPRFAFGERNREHVRQLTPGIAYELRWKGIGSLGLGVQRSLYRKSVYVPGVATTSTRDDGWLYNASLALDISSGLAFYASASSGLEESGIAPESAANRREVLPAIHTKQVDAGMRVVLPAGLRLVAGLFDVRKPYFAVDGANVYAEAGRIRHRGAEISLSGAPAAGLNIVAGAVLMDPTVSGPQVDAGILGRRSLGDTGRVITVSANYSPPALPKLALGVNAYHHGSRTANILNLSSVPAATLIDLSARYRLRIAGKPALLRVQINNVTDRIDLSVQGHNSFGFNTLRSFALFLTVDA